MASGKMTAAGFRIGRRLRRRPARVCQQNRRPRSDPSLQEALANGTYTGRSDDLSKTADRFYKFKDSDGRGLACFVLQCVQILPLALIITMRTFSRIFSCRCARVPRKVLRG
jgi:hypothetical protein